MLHHHGDGDLRVVVGREADQHGVGLAVYLSHLGGARLGAHLHRQAGKGASDAALVGHQIHAVLDRLQVLLADVHAVQQLGLILIDHLREVAGLDVLEDVGGVPVAAVDQSGNVVGQLERGDLGIALADGGGEQVAAVPGGAQLLAGLGTGHPAAVPAQLKAGALPQAEHGGVLADEVDAQPVAHGVEVDVAGVLDGVGHVLHAVAAAVLEVVPAGGVVVAVGVLLPLGVPEAAGVQDFLRGGHQSLLEGRHTHNHLEGGARGVQAVDGPVVEGLQGVVEGLIVEGGVAVNGGQVVGGVGGHGQYASGHVGHHHGAALGVLRLQALNAVGQGPLGRLLEADVNGQAHIAPRLRLQRLAGLAVGKPVLGDNLAVCIGVDGPLSRSALQVGLKGQLHAVLAHGVVHLVSVDVLIVLPVV